ncbi:MAG: GAF domain-containing protein [Anaerolineae bacterium]|nr:GAF domain-containing protein [Anaerolineae bacterium]
MSGKCILVVEDELIIAENIRVMLTNSGYVVPPPAVSAAEALRILESLRPDMVLIDIQLEGSKNGIHLAEQIRKRFGIPLVYLTAYADEETVRQALDTEPYGYLVKPFSAAELRTTVDLAFFRYELERQLSAREARYRAIVETLSELVLRLRPDGTIIFANSACARLLGRQESDLLDQNFLSLIIAEDQAVVREQLGSLSRKKPVSDGDARLNTGAPYPPRIWWHYTAIYSEQGSLLEIQIVGRDVSQRSRAEEALRERNAWLERLNQARQVFFSSLELEQVVTHILETLCQQMNVAASSMWLIDEQTGELVCHYATEPGKKAVLGWRLAPGQGIAGWVASTGHSLLVPDVRRDPRHFKAVGEQTGLRIVSMISVPLRVQERVIGVLEVMDKMPNRFTQADLKHVELLATAASLAIQNAYLYREAHHLRLFNEQIVQSMDEGIAIEDTAGVITFANPRLAQMLRCEVADLLGRRWSDILPPEEAAVIAAECHRRPYAIPSRYEMTLQARDGERIPVMVSTRSLFRRHPTGRDELLDGPDGTQFAGTLSVFTDIRELKRSQQALQYRLAAEELLATVSAQLLNTPPEQTDQAIEHALATLADFTHADYVAIPLIGEDGFTVRGCCSWHAAGTPEAVNITLTSLKQLPWYSREALRGEPLVINQVAQLPEEATVERALLQAMGIRSVLWAPILQGERIAALPGLYATRSERAWTQEDARLTRLVGENILHALTRQRATRELEMSLREKELLIQEVQRRVNENLQLICSLLELQMSASTDPRVSQACAETLARVHTIGLTYETLLRSSEPRCVDLADMLPLLVQRVRTTHSDIPRNIALEVPTRPVRLNPGAAVALTLLVHELLIHVLTHAFPPERNAQYQPSQVPFIRIALEHMSSDEAMLRLSHNGAGEMVRAAYFASTALSPRLIRVLVAQLHGKLDVEENGTAFVVTFPVVRSDQPSVNDAQGQVERMLCRTSSNGCVL